MKSIDYKHAAQRKTLVGYVYNEGSNHIKEKVLDSLDEKFSSAHREGRIHIHDLEAYGESYNCLTPDLVKGFPYDEINDNSDVYKIMEIFYYLKKIVIGLGNEQSGGIGFGNFDCDMSEILTKLDVSLNQETRKIFKKNLDLFMRWNHEARDRCGQVQYYLTFNLGLSITEIGRFLTKSVITLFMNSYYIHPNIIFKVKSGVNRNERDKNYDLFKLAKKCTAKKMIPTYYLADSEHNQIIDPYKISLMGCRSKVYQNQYGEDTTIGKSNVVYTSISLPRIAFDINKGFPDLNLERKLELYEKKWKELADIVKDQLFDRFYKISKLENDDFPTNQQYKLMFKDITNLANLEDYFKHGTLAIGFIGLSETIEIMTGKKYFSSEENYEIALNLVKMMRDTIDEYREKYNYNFSLLGTSGEYISGRFPEVDSMYYSHPIIKKGFYTNSFHVDVNSGLNPFDKISYEGSFHKYCNGGCITYLEFRSAPLRNVEAISELIEHAIKSDVNYLGFNYPLDICLDCGNKGTYDNCEKCGSENIKRIRRVSGYLEDSSFFTKGKQAEVAHRTPNM
ncbi:MAG: hypothetical protein GF311_17220 [Candidatus Lokiarchaeota archaeon]|nr:hypothetical protein [Candidatus Lokiarchaeota archaeon]